LFFWCKDSLIFILIGPSLKTQVERLGQGMEATLTLDLCSPKTKQKQEINR